MLCKDETELKCLLIWFVELFFWILQRSQFSSILGLWDRRQRWQSFISILLTYLYVVILLEQRKTYEFYYSKTFLYLNIGIRGTKAFFVLQLVQCNTVHSVWLFSVGRRLWGLNCTASSSLTSFLSWLQHFWQNLSSGL